MDSDTIALANAIYGEAADQEPEVMKMVGSSVINRINSGRTAEFGSNMQEVLNKGYYAVKNPNVPYRQALTQQFPDEESANQYKQALAIAGGLRRGTIEPDKALFYFTPKEEAKLRKTPKVFNFKIVKNAGKVGGYNTYNY